MNLRACFILAGWLLAMPLAFPGCDRFGASEHATKNSGMEVCYAQAKQDFFKGLELYDRKQFADADAQFALVRRQCPEAPFGWHGAFIVAMALGDEDAVAVNAQKTIDLLGTVKRQHPELWDGYLHFLAGVCLAQGLNDAAGAKPHYREACVLGEGRGCSNLGWILEKDEEQPAQAIQWYTRGCDLNYGRACTNRGVIEETVNTDTAAAMVSYTRGCELLHPAGCRNASLLLQKEGKEQPAAVLLKKACDLGDEVACDQMPH